MNLKKSSRPIAKITKDELKESVSKICKKLGKTRAWYYKGVQQVQKKESNDNLVLSYVYEERAINPRAGTRKLYVAVNSRLAEQGKHIGKHSLYKLLKKHNLLLEKRKSLFCRTTQRDPSLPVSPNLVQGMTLTSPNQVLSSDITYIRVGNGFVYLVLIMDDFSKDIVGWAVSDSLKTDFVIEALKMAKNNLPKGVELIHHSDRGCQFASHAFRKLLQEFNWQSSMTEKWHCFENAISERLNGILKGEYYLDRVFPSKKEAETAIKKVINTYNTQRLHEKLGYKTPQAFRREFFRSIA